MLTYAGFVLKLAIAVLLNVQSTIKTIIVNAVPQLVFVVLNLAVKWQLLNKR